MTQPSWYPAEEAAIASFLAQGVAEHLSGRAEDECAGNVPHDVYFIGNLRPLSIPDPEAPGAAARDELRSKLAPMAFGLDFCVLPGGSGIEAEVSLSWSVYYRIFPTLAEQRRYQVERTALWTQRSEPDEPQASPAGIPARHDADADNSVAAGEEDESDPSTDVTGPEDIGSAADRRASRRSSDTMFSRWRKIPCRATGRVVIPKNLGRDTAVDVTGLSTSVEAEIQRAVALVSSDPSAARVRTAGKRVQVPEGALASEETYQAFLHTLRVAVKPVWQWEITPAAAPETATVQVSLIFANASPDAQQDDPNIEPFFFDVGSEVAFHEGEAVPFQLELAPRDFRFDPSMPARGFNCAVVGIPECAGVFRSTMWPVHEQMRYETRTQPAAFFAELAADPLPVLEEISASMYSSLSDWDVAEAAYGVDPEWAERHAAVFAGERARFEQEISRFNAGVELIRAHPDVATAFQLTNEVFHRLGDHPLPERRKDRWRLFQIVFLLTQLPGMAELTGATPQGTVSEREIVDIVYFPTGGGKTEAYLAVIVFHCFYDRLRGKQAGVTAWTRFPLRLLTLQQTQRMADVIGGAELVRRVHSDARLSDPAVDPFAVGYFVGKTGSPNELVAPGTDWDKADDVATWSQANDPVARQDWKRVARCPACRTPSVQVDFDTQHIRLLHRCTNEGCAFPDGVLPVYVVDNESFRYLPSVLVGTIDKLAALGNQRKLSQLFGRVTDRCPDHGYRLGKCAQKGCTVRGGWLPLPSGLSGPTLFVQDELHLLKEGLGTFDGHYETFTQRLLTRFGNRHPLKIIASSATIEAFERQVEHLYGRPRDRARIFPGPGPRAGESFYAQTLQHPQRLYMGVIPHNKTIFNASLELLERYHREVAKLLAIPAGAHNPYGGQVAPGTAQWTQLLDLYQTSLTYFNANRELNSFRTDIEGDVNPVLQADGIGRLGLFELTGSTLTDEVSSILEHLESPHPETHDAVLATNMISHGVDVDRLNAMFFYGMPRQNAEYIQASSRVGRTHCGLVFVCLHPARERDQSHFAYFRKYHEYVGTLVEPVAINRWAKFSVERTLPGLFMATLLQVIAHGPGETNPGSFYQVKTLKQRITSGRTGPSDFIDLLEDAYLVTNPTNATEQAVQDEIRHRVQLFLDQIVAADGTRGMVSDVIRPRPLMSLRDVDETIPVYLDGDGAAWARRAGRS